MRMFYFGGALAFISFLSGALSAYYWYLASKVKSPPAWKLDIDRGTDWNVMSHVTGALIALTKSGSLNKRAAKWAALAVAAGTAANAVSFFSNPR
jgi:hypothetical protein